MGKAHDEKAHIMTSTTRKGTTLSTSAALDSPSVISQLITPPNITCTIISAESENTSDNFDDASTILDESGLLGPFLDATLVKSRQIENVESKIIVVMILMKFMWNLMMILLLNVMLLLV